MKICAIIVLYNPDFLGLDYLIADILLQVGHVYLVDNSAVDNKAHFTNKNVSYIFLNGNKGIAKAQNIGIEECIKEGYEYIVFCDQDSSIPQNAIAGLIDSYNLLKSKGIKVGAVGSRAINKENGRPYSLGCNLIKENVFSYLSEVSYTMNSISLFSVSYFKEIGLMDEKLFIDGVDSEICWRGAVQKYRFFINNKIKINHLLGLGCKKIGKKYISITPPKRMYYQYRNFIYLSKKKYVPKSWVRYNGKKYLVKILYYPTMMSPRHLYAKYILLGMLDGIRTN